MVEILDKIDLRSYDELQKIDIGLMKRVIHIACSNKVPVSMPIDNKTH